MTHSRKPPYGAGLLVGIGVTIVLLTGCPQVAPGPTFSDGRITVRLINATGCNGSSFYYMLAAGPGNYGSGLVISDGCAEQTLCDYRDGVTPILVSGGETYTIDGYIDSNGDGGPGATPTTGVDYVLRQSRIGVVNGDTTVTFDYSSDFEVAPGGVPALQLTFDYSAIASGSSVDLGTPVVGLPIEFDFVIQNNGTARLNLIGLPTIEKSGTGSDSWTVTQEPATMIIPGESTTFAILLNPTSAGAISTLFSIPSNVQEASPFTFTVDAKLIRPPVVIPRTGQTTSYAAGDDGDLGSGVDWPVPRFADNGDGTTTDTLTGLMWQKAPPTTESNWDNTLTYAGGLTLAGYDDWHLPNVNELMSLIDFGQANTAQALNAGGLFSGVRADTYWTSTRTPYTPYGVSYAWIVNAGTGAPSRLAPYVLTVTYGWGVRYAGGGVVELPWTGRTSFLATGDDGDLQYGVVWPYPRFVECGNGIMGDRLTGMMWEQSPDTTARTWSSALEYAAGLDLGGYTDWRLPNINELRVLLNYQYDSMSDWLYSSGFYGVKGDEYWTSTTCASNAVCAWTVDMSVGYLSCDGKTMDRYAWAVRGGE